MNFLGDQLIKSEVPSANGTVAVTLNDDSVTHLSPVALQLIRTAKKSDASKLRDAKVTAVTAQCLKAALDFDLDFDDLKYLQSLLGQSIQNAYEQAIAGKFGRKFKDKISMSDVDFALKAQKAVPETKS